MSLSNAVHVVRNKRELNSLLRNYRPSIYKTVYEWLKKQPRMLPKRYPAVVFIGRTEDTQSDGTFYTFDYMYEKAVKVMAKLVDKAIATNNRTTRRRKMTGTLPAEIRESREVIYRSSYLDDEDKKKIRASYPDTTGITFMN